MLPLSSCRTPGAPYPPANLLCETPGIVEFVEHAADPQQPRRTADEDPHVHRRPEPYAAHVFPRNRILAIAATRQQRVLFDDRVAPAAGSHDGPHANRRPQ